MECLPITCWVGLRKDRWKPGGSGETGRRGRRPLRIRLSMEEQTLGGRRTHRSAPTGWSIGRRAVPEGMADREKGSPGRNGRPVEGQFLGNGLTRGSGPTKRVFRSAGMFSLWKWPTGRRADPEESGHIPPTTGSAAAERGACPFGEEQTPAKSDYAREVIPAPPIIQARPCSVSPGETGRRIPARGTPPP